MNKGALPTTQTDFLRVLLHDYVPSERERIASSDVTYLPGSTYPSICQTRTWLLWQALVTHLDLAHTSGISDVLDVGPYPGTQARLLHHIAAKRFRLTGAGLSLQPSFRDDMSGVMVAMYDVDLDPFYSGWSVPIRIPCPDESFDAIYALEIFEHLITPLPFLSEASRLLKPGAILCLSTPNVAQLGGIYRLLCGRSNYEILDASPMYQVANKWRGHSRTYAKDELITLGQRFGLDCIEHRYYREVGAGFLSATTSSRIKSTLGSWVQSVIPHVRDDQFVVLRKSAATSGSSSGSQHASLASSTTDHDLPAHSGNQP